MQIRHGGSFGTPGVYDNQPGLGISFMIFAQAIEYDGVAFRRVTTNNQGAVG